MSMAKKLKNRKTSTSKAPSKRKQQKKKIIVTSVAVGAAGILGYFGWQYLKKNKQVAKGDLESLIRQVPSSYNEAEVTAPVSNAIKPKPKSKSSYAQPIILKTDDFPLSKGSKGDNVKALQEALITKYGKSILPKYGADGDFGSETIQALIKAGLPGTISQSTFNVLVQSSGTITNPSEIGKALYDATIGKNFNSVITLLKKLKNTSEYSTAGEVFKQNRINGVRQTIVNGLLNVFTTEDQKQKIRFEFLRIGLQYDGSKWSLSGLDGLPLVTVRPTKVWLSASQSVSVPAKMVLGNEINKRLDYTLFENKGQYFLVPTKTVKYL
jgi:hypothetical protein